MNKVYRLCDYGIPLSIVIKLKDYDLESLEYESDQFIKDIKGLTISRFSHIKYILKQPEFRNDKKISLYELYEYGFDERQIKILKEVAENYNDLVELNFNNLNISTQLKKKLNSEIGEVERKIRLSSGANLKRNFKDLLLENIKELILPYEKISIIKLKNLLTLKKNYPIGNYINELNELIDDSQVCRCMEGIYYKNLTLDEYLLTIEDSKKRMMLYQKFKGQSLEAISKQYDLTRERVRQIIVKEMSKFPLLKEDFYKEYFEKYEWKKEVFIRCFNESEMTWYYLSQRYQMGEELVDNLLKDEEFPLIRRKNLAECLKYIEVLGEEIKEDPNEILNLILLKKAIKPIGTDELMKIYNDVILNSNLDKKYLIDEIRNFEGKLQRSKYCISGIKSMVRYYDIEKIGSEEKEKIIYMLNDYDIGEYSTLIFFNENIDLMEELDIADEYELHNLLRNLDLKCDKEIIYSKMPHILIGIEEKKMFFDNILQMLAPDTLENIVDYLYNNYGQKRDSTIAYLTKEYKRYINHGILAIEKNILEEELVEKIRNRLTDDLCTISNAKEIFQMFIGEEYNKYFNSYNLDVIGYKLKNNYIQKNSILNLDEYICNIIKNKE